MGETNIAWADFTFNGWRGCTKVSPACANCYAEALSIRYGLGEYKKGVPRIRTSEANWKKPYKWNKSLWQCDGCGEWRYLDPILTDSSGNALNTTPCLKCKRLESLHLRRPRVFSLSLGDWLDDEVPIEWLADMLKVVWETPNLDWLLLTKRPENWKSRIDQACDNLMNREIDHKPLFDWALGTPLKNVRIGITAENQKQWDLRSPHFFNIPSSSRFVSIEPMLSDIDLSLEGTVAGKFKPAYMMIDQIIVGGESGSDHKNRMLDLKAAASIYAQCRQWGVKFFMKQDSGPRAGMRGRIPDELWVQEFPG